MVSNLGKYTFLKEQYCQVINSLIEAVEKDELISKQKKDSEWKKEIYGSNN